MITPEEITRLLRSNLRLYGELLAIVEAEAEALRSADGNPPQLAYGAKKDLLPRLSATLDPLAECRTAWQAMDAAVRARHSEISDLVRRNQDALMKILLLDRQNEQALLRHGLVPPKELPSVNRQRPHFVADLYRRRGGQ